MRFFPDTNGTSIAFTIHSVKEVLGTPRYQSTAAQRPILGRPPKGGRRNLLTYTEQFDNAAWTKAAVSISANATTGIAGTSTADKLVEETSTGLHQVNQGSVTTTAAAWTFYVHAKAAERSWIALAIADSGGTVRITYFDLSGSGAIGTTDTGITASITNRGNGFFRCAVTIATAFAGANRPRVYLASGNNGISYTGDGTSGVYLDCAQLEPGSTATAYQAVASTYDCTETGVPDCYYLQADGSDDGMVTPTLDLSATDKIGVFTAVRKLSDAAAAMVAEFSASTGGNNGSFGVQAPAGASASLRFVSRGTAEISATYTNAAVAAPYTAVLTGIGDISGDSVILRANGVQVASAATNQGTGNFGNYALYFFRRGGASLPFNGLEYGYALGDALPSAAQITSMENYYNGIVGAY